MAWMAGRDGGQGWQGWPAGWLRKNLQKSENRTIKKE